MSVTKKVDFLKFAYQDNKNKQFEYERLTLMCFYTIIEGFKMIRVTYRLQ